MMTLQNGRSSRLSAGLLLSIYYLCLFTFGASGLGHAATVKDAAHQDIRAFFKGTGKTVLTFVGYSGAGRG
jgi:hypothetical protein